MKLKTCLVVIALMTAPGHAFALGCSKGENKITASSCAAGTVWDAIKESCVTPVNS